MRRRRHAQSTTNIDQAEDIWETYKFFLDGEVQTMYVLPNGDSDSEQGTALYVSKAGAAVPLDSQSIAVAFGNTVKVIKSTRRGSLRRRPTGRTFDREPVNSMDP